MTARHITTTACIAAAALFFLAGSVRAGMKIDIRGIKVSISNGGDAYLDPEDGTLTVEPAFDFAKIKVAAGSRALAGWGWACDVYILADDYIVPAIQTKGTRDTYLYIAGQTYHCDSFKGTLTFIGNTLPYGLTGGLGMTSYDIEGWPFPKQAALKSGWATAHFLSLNIHDTAPTKSLETKLPGKASAILFGN